MDEKQKKEYQTVILGALLHDVGKFYQRGLEKGKGDHQQLGDECFEEYFAEGLSNLFSQDEIGIIRSAINNHHEHAKFVTHADCLSAGMDRIKRIELGEEEHGDPSKERLQSVFEKICLGKNDAKANEYTYHLKPLSLIERDLFPAYKLPEKDLREEYKSLWEGFVEELKNIPIQNLRSYLNALYAILQKYTWCIPSAAYKHEPDISLFDHAKTTAAIAGCLYHCKRAGESTDKEFLLVTGDISGIQNFIYKITKSQGEGGISKRLRGRSFYLLLLQEVIAKYIIEQVGLFTTNILFCGGGRFELLLPNTDGVKKILNKDVNEWLFEEHGGELGLVIETVEAAGNGLLDYGDLLKNLDEKLSIAKKRKFLSLFNDSSFLVEAVSKDKGIEICKVCNISNVNDDKEPCDNCNLHKNIGSKLPKTSYLIYATKKVDDIDGLKVLFGKFGVVYLVEDKWLESENILDIQRINNLDDLKTSFRFIGNTAPVAKESFSIDDGVQDEDKKVDKGHVLSFEMLADASIGDKRIGILKMDVDFLGFIFAIGLEDEKNQRKSISRIASLSRSMDIFFAGYLNKICDDIFQEWHKESDWKHKDKVEQIFYIVYSGGDDLLIVGPWSEMPRLAKKIRDEFKKYTCENPDINISAGIFFCKPKYPISLAAKAAGEQLETSKDNGRRRITLFGENVEWVDGEAIGFENLFNFGEILFDAINTDEKENRLPRGFVHGLLRKHKQYESGNNLNYIPALIYQMERNVKKSAKVKSSEKTLKEELKEKLLTVGNGYFKKIKIPASYALLKSRKEG